MKFADEFIESAGQVATMVEMMQTITGRQVPLVFDSPYGKVILRVERYVEPSVEEMEASKENAQPTPEGD